MDPRPVQGKASCKRVYSDIWGGLSRNICSSSKMNTVRIFLSLSVNFDREL